MMVVGLFVVVREESKIRITYWIGNNYFPYKFLNETLCESYGINIHFNFYLFYSLSIRLKYTKHALKVCFVWVMKVVNSLTLLLLNTHW